MTRESGTYGHFFRLREDQLTALVAALLLSGRLANPDLLVRTGHEPDKDAQVESVVDLARRIVAASRTAVWPAADGGREA